MRRFFTYLFALGVFTCMAAGCHRPWCCCEHGVCDCYQLGPCVTRQPWVIDAPPPPPELPAIPPKKL